MAKNKTDLPEDKDVTAAEVTEVAEAEIAETVAEVKEGKEMGEAAEAVGSLETSEVIAVPEVPEVQEVKVMSPNVVVISEADNPRAKWYIVHVYSGHENKVSEALRQRAQTLNLEGMILQTLIPTQEKIQIKRGQRKTVNEKIFPGYMLIKMELNDQSWLAVRTTQGVTGFVGTGGNKPLPLSKAEVEAIQKYVSQTAPKFKVDYLEGEAVRITDGPFNDFLGTVSKIDEARGKLEVLINIFGRETPVELDFLQVQKVS